jgi:hypothetical protein
MIYQCIGIDESGARCTSIVNVAPFPDHPTWPFLCSQCANQPPRKGSRNSLGIVLERPVSA